MKAPVARRRVSVELRDALDRRYGQRPKDYAHVLANAEAWERLKAIAHEPTVVGGASGG